MPPLHRESTDSLIGLGRYIRDYSGLWYVLNPKFIGVASRGLHIVLRHVTMTITKWFPNMGSCPGYLPIWEGNKSFISTDRTW